MIFLYFRESIWSVKNEFWIITSEHLTILGANTLLDISKFKYKKYLFNEK